jgi:aspartate/methionine/tyrosine aminotransferase
LKISQRVAGVEYAIRDIAPEARKLEKEGKQITYLNIGDPLQYGFAPPDRVKEALINAVREGQNYYATSEGLPELRQAISKKESLKGLRVSEDHILVTNGVSEGLEMIMASIVEAGDEILIPGPYFPPYASYVRLFRGKPVEFSVDLKNSTPDLDDIRSKISNKTIAICLISPNNPTGVVFSEKSLKDLVNLANEHDLYIICDEIYDQIVFDEKFTGIGKVCHDSPVILLNGFSKVHLMSGWRIGYIAFNQSKKLELLRENVPKLSRVRIATNLPVQYAALESLNGPQDYITKFVLELKKRRDFTIKKLNDIAGISCSNPKGAFYAFPKIENTKFKSDKDFVLQLLKSTGILTVHGSGFGTQYGTGHFRMVFLPEIRVLEGALNKIEKFLTNTSS